jgi:c-di-GMP-related signal transduction protein
MRCFVARQPIFDRRLDVFAYELLFRSGFDDFCDIDGSEGDVASSEVLTTSFVITGLQELTGGRKVSINFTRNLLLQEIPTLFPPEMLLVEVLEDVTPKPEVVTACRKLKNAGYRILLDDFTPEYFQSPLLEYADIIKVDFQECSVSDWQDIPRRLENRGLQFLAEKVETVEQFRQAVESNYTYLQGYFFSKPVVRTDSTIPGSKLVYLRIMNEINKPGVDFTDVERIVKQDVSLSYKLLRFINSAYFGLTQPVTSIGHALALLGMREVKKWVALSALSRLAEDEPQELIVHSMVRARLCECLAGKIGLRNRGQELFLMGVFSLVDAIIGKPMSEILGQLPLTEETKSALLGADHLFRDVLDLVISYERGDWPRFSSLAATIQLAEDAMPDLYRESMRWVNQAMKVHIGEPHESPIST